MSATDRQNRLLVAEDWKRIYQSYKNADFQSYDFDNLRRIMITYIRENYPEDFNDYIESSEYLALIDLIAFLGQSISFRTDLNARENFLELADRRESVLRLAKLLSYNPKRNVAATGLLKFVSVQTSQNVYDANGRNIAGHTILWNDTSNQNWFDQFIRVINASLSLSSQFGNPAGSATIYGIPTEQYRFQTKSTDVPVYSFSRTIEGKSMNFEVVSTGIRNAADIYEEPPLKGNKLAFLYRNDGKGYGSNNTGFFVQFKQGSLGSGSFTLTQPSTNESVDIDTPNINNNDVWLYQLDHDGNESTLWTEIPALEGNNVIYNSLSKAIKKIFAVSTRTNDRVSLLFSDGTFGDLPTGAFRTYYRSSNGLNYTINTKDMRNVILTLPYISNTNQLETITINMNLVTSVANSVESETNDSIKVNAPATYYTQNRMITGEDYNISPLSATQDVLKIKSINRSSSGISRYFDLVDPTGKYSKTNLFSDDGAIYIENYTDSFRFSYMTKTEIEYVINNKVLGALKSIELRDFYYNNFKKYLTTTDISWVTSTFDTNSYTGLLYYNSAPVAVGSGAQSGSLLRFITPGALLKFKYWDSVYNGYRYKWTTVSYVSGNGTTVENGIGPMYITDDVPAGAVLIQIIPALSTSLSTNLVSSLVDLIYENKPFGLRYDIETTSWKIIYDVDLNKSGDFSLLETGNTSRRHKDSSWLLLFTTDTEYYTVKQRLLRYVFESENQVRFYFNKGSKIYDSRSNIVVKDQIKILGINIQNQGEEPNDRIWEISNQFYGADGYVDNKKIQLSFSDTDDDGIVDNPSIFDEYVTNNEYIVQKGYDTDIGYEYKLSTDVYRYTKLGGVLVGGITEDGFAVVHDVIIVDNDTVDLTEYFIGTDDTHAVELYFYIVSSKVVKKLVWDTSTTKKLILSTERKVYNGKEKVKFQYIHNATNDARIDPGLTNIMDVYVLTKQYDTAYRQWVAGAILDKPLPPSSDSLYALMSTKLNKIKSISDEIVYHPVKFKILFGQKSNPDVRATFKVVKNSEIVISDNDVKSQVLTAINTFFNLENWDFGDKFHFSELQTYVMNQVSPYVVNFIIVPTMTELTFGSLYEINAEKDEIFINGATIDDIEIINSITASKIKSAGQIALETTGVTNITITSSRNN